MNQFKNINILVTGGAGFIGSNLTKMLVRSGANVTVLDLMLSPYGGNMFNLKDTRNKIKFIKGDIRSMSVVRKAVDGKDFVFHLAGQTGRVNSIQNPFLDTSINCIGTLTILDAIKKQNVKSKVIFTSSRGVYGEPRYLPVDERHPISSKDIYGINKRTAEQYCLFYGKEYNIGVTVLRLNNVYGPRCQIKSNHYGTINLFISAALQGKELLLFGDGTQTRDYIYINDTIDALIASMDKKADGELFMVGTGESYSLTDIAQIIKKEIPLTEYRFIPYPENLLSIDFHDFRSDPRKINKVLGWRPKIRLEDGIKKTIHYYKRYLRNYL